jgi:hypothetical protein
MVPALFALRQHDIVNQVLWYCAAPCDANSLTMLDTFPPTNTPFVPHESAWLATAARTCKAWLEPALRHLYHTIYLRTTGRAKIQAAPLDRFHHIGHLVRSLVISVHASTPYGTKLRTNHFKNLTSLTTLVVSESKKPELDLLADDIRACPSLPKLVNLHLSTPNKHAYLGLLEICKNLRRLRLDGRYMDEPSEVVARPERLEEFVVEYYGYLDSTLAALFTATTLVTLNVNGPRNGPSEIDYRLLGRAIEASSRTLRAVSIYYDQPINYHDTEWVVKSRALARALTLCTSLRFLRLGFPILARVPLRELLGLLRTLPIELLSFPGYPTWLYRDLDVEIFFPRLLAVMVESNPDYYSTRDMKMSRLAKFSVLMEFYTETDLMWPPTYQTLSPEAQAIFMHRPYRAASPSSPTACILILI